MAVDFLQFLFNLILAGFLLRTLEAMLQGSDLEKALRYIY